MTDEQLLNKYKYIKDGKEIECVSIEELIDLMQQAEPSIYDVPTEQEANIMKNNWQGLKSILISTLKKENINT